MDKDKTTEEHQLDEDLPVEDESAEQVAGGHRGAVRKPATRHATRRP